MGGDIAKLQADEQEILHKLSAAFAAVHRSPGAQTDPGGPAVVGTGALTS